MATSERRCAPTEFEVRAKQDGTGGSKYVIEGHGAVFNRLSQNLGGFVERVAPDAFKRTLGDNPDVRALINHDPSLLLGRSRSGTLRLATDDTGLHYEIDSPETQYARDLIVSMERGDLSHSSFGFYVREDEWDETDQGMPLRTLTAVSIHNGDVSPVTYPAYEDADSGIAGRAFQSLAEARSLDVDTVRAAAESGSLRDLISGETPPAVDLDAIRSAAARRARLLDMVERSTPRDLG